MPPSPVWLIRHGESTANAGLMTRNASASPLTARGREQAERTAAKVVTRPDLLIVSPMQRAIETAAPIVARWPDVPQETWAIQEFTYLSHAKVHGLNVAGRRPMASAYWQRENPDYVDGDDAESFTHFARRLQAFHERLLQQTGFVVVVGHGQFFHAYKTALARGLEVSPQWMREFRRADLVTPLSNGEILVVEPAGIVLA